MNYNVICHLDNKYVYQEVTGEVFNGLIGYKFNGFNGSWEIDHIPTGRRIYALPDWIDEEDFPLATIQSLVQEILEIPESILSTTNPNCPRLLSSLKEVLGK